LSVTDTVQNQGAVATPIGFRVGFYLHPHLGADVVIITNRPVAALAAGSSNTGTTNLIVPASTPPNDYYVCAKADSLSQVAETDETNNTLCTGTLVTVPQPDLTVTAVSTTATTVKAGGTITVSNSIKNIGGSKAGSSVVAFHLSTDTTFGGVDDVASTTTRTIASLAINATSTASTGTKVPASTPAGIYYVCVQADKNNSVAEVDETNNDRCTMTTITVTVTP
jgi:subtilase family serine protease